MPQSFAIVAQCFFLFLLVLVPPAADGLSLQSARAAFGLGSPTSRGGGGQVLDVPPQVEAFPWTQSISPKRRLAYMPALEAQLEVIKQLGLECVSIEERFVHQASEVKPARIGNLCFQGGRFRKVRLTYFDAGESVQVFNALWYPSFELDCPLLGVDLISLGASRVLSVVDFQPLHPTAEYALKYISPLAEIHARYPDLQGKMSGKFYDDTSFFSSQMLFGRFTNEALVESVVLPGHAEYLLKYVDTVLAAVPDGAQERVETVMQRQADYDTFSAAKDPAVGLFDAYFGKEWSHDFVHKFLFDRAGRSETSPTHTFSVNPATGDATIRSQLPPRQS